MAIGVAFYHGKKLGFGSEERAKKREIFINGGLTKIDPGLIGREIHVYFILCFSTGPLQLVTRRSFF